MNENEQMTTPPAAGDRPSGWFAFQEKPVMLQLSEPYMACDYSYGPCVDKEGNVRATPILQGILHVEPDGAGGMMLVVEMHTGHGNDVVLIAVKPRDVVFCSHIVQSQIITQ
jgi:hypothetical protein